MQASNPYSSLSTVVAAQLRPTVAQPRPDMMHLAATFAAVHAHQQRALCESLTRICAVQAARQQECMARLAAQQAARMQAFWRQMPRPDLTSLLINAGRSPFQDRL